jgi:non-ribosomal peptide synthetase component F
VLVVTIHHVVSDGWSLSIIISEIAELYNARVEKRPVLLPRLKIQYADYAIWQRRFLEGEILDKKVEYWKEKLHGIEPLQLLTDYPRPPMRSIKGAITGFTINKETSEKLQALSKQQGTTLFMTLLAAFKVLLFRYTNQEDICVGTGAAGRQQQEMEGLIGFFVNTLALRSRVGTDTTFAELLQQVKTTTLEAYEHQEVPFEKVVDNVSRERNRSVSPVFQVMFELQNASDASSHLRLGKMEIARHPFAHSTSKYDLTLFISESPTGLQASIEYCTELFSKETIGRMAAHFKELLEAIVITPEEKIRALPMLTATEIKQLLIQPNDTASPYPAHNSLIELFEARVASAPAATAVVFEEKRSFVPGIK